MAAKNLTPQDRESLANLLQRVDRLRGNLATVLEDMDKHGFESIEVPHLKNFLRGLGYCENFVAGANSAVTKSLENAGRFSAVTVVDEELSEEIRKEIEHALERKRSAGAEAYSVTRVTYDQVGSIHVTGANPEGARYTYTYDASVNKEKKEEED